MLYIGAAKNHLALYGALPVGFKDRLKDFTVSKGAIQFTPKRPLSAVLVKDIVKAKAAESDARWPVKVKKAETKKSAKKK